MGNSGNPALNRWTLARRDGSASPTQVFVAQGQTRTDSTAMILSLVQSGLGIGRIIDLAARPAVEAGQLVPVLPDWWAEAPVPMYAVMLQERQRLPKLRACVAYWAERFSADPAGTVGG